VPQDVFDGIVASAKGDRFAWFTDFYSNFYNLDENLGTRISQAAVDGSWNVAIASAPVAAYAVVPSWTEDFRGDVDAVKAAGIPTLIMHGTKDRILPKNRYAAGWEKVLSHADWVDLEGLGHVPMSDDPARIGLVLLGGSSTTAA